MTKLEIYAIVAVLFMAGSFATGWKVNGWRINAQAKHDEQLVAKASDAMTTVAVDAIGKIKPTFTTVNKGFEKEFHSEVRYTSPDCSHTPESWRLLDRAYQAAGGEPFSGDAGVPAPAAPAGPDAGSDNPGTGSGLAGDHL
jgi:hypothetical protein